MGMIQNGRIEISAAAQEFYERRDIDVQSPVMKAGVLILNTPWTLCGLLLGMLSFPVGLKIEEGGIIVINVRRIWLSEAFMGCRVAGATAGSVILLSDIAEGSTYAHERIHVRQFEAAPFLFPLFYWVELFKNGYMKNKYEEEAYWLTQNNPNKFK